MCARGYPQKFAENCFKQIEGFGEYGFPESHAASFALLVYASAWIKCHYPDVFLLRCSTASRWAFTRRPRSCATRRSTASRCGAVDVNCSNWDCTLESTPVPQGRLHPRHASMAADILTTHAVRLGFRQIDGFSEDWAKKIESVRGQRLRFRPRSLAAHRLAAQGAAKARSCRRVQFAWAEPPRCAMGREGAAARRRQGQSAAVRARVHAGARARRCICRHAAGRAGDRGLSPSASVVEGASGVVPAPRFRRARHRPHELLADDETRPPRDHRRARAGAPAARQRATPSS